MGIFSAIAGIGSALIGARSARKQAKAQGAATQASIDASLKGFNYLQGNANVAQAQTQGAAFGQQMNRELGADGRLQQIMGRGEGIMARGQEIMGQNDQIIGRGNEILGDGQRIMDRGEQMFGQGQQLFDDNQRMMGMGQSLLGMGDGSPESLARGQQAFENYQNSTGFQFRMGQGMNAITGNAASRGLLNSGATLQGLNDYGQGMGSQEFGNFMGQFNQQLQNNQMQFGNFQNQFGNNQTMLGNNQQQFGNNQTMLGNNQTQMGNNQTMLGNQQNFIGMIAGERDTGLNAAFNVANSGASGGAGAANSIMQGAANTNAIRQQGTNNIVAGLGAAAGGFTDMYNQSQRRR